MARTREGVTSIQLVVPDEAKKALAQLAEVEELPSVSALIRALLEGYCRNNGYDVSFDVGSWGGHRKREDESLKSQQIDPGTEPIQAWVDQHDVYVRLADGRLIATPIAWYGFLENATPDQRAKIELQPSGIWWTDLDDGLSIDGMLLGPNEKIKKRLAEKVTV